MLQATQAPTTTSAPSAPAVPTAVIVTGPDGAQQSLPVPMTHAEFVALKMQRTELSNQLTSAADRRHQLSEELRSAPAGASRAGLEERIAILDKRMVQLESDIAATGRQLSAAPLAAVASGSGSPGDGDVPENVAALSGAFIVFVLFPLALALARLLWKRGTRMSAATAVQQLPTDAVQRLDRLEHGMDAIAIEIERVSEGQRFVTGLLSKKVDEPVNRLT